MAKIIIDETLLVDYIDALTDVTLFCTEMLEFKDEIENIIVTSYPKRGNLTLTESLLATLNKELQTLQNLNKENPAIQ